MSSSYERELRRVLSGDRKTIDSITRSCSEIEKSHIMMVINRPFLVVRAAGSGMEGSGDLVALRGDISFPVEVKSTKSKKLYLSGRTKIQYEAMVKEGEKTGLMPLYAHRLKGVRGDSWRIFRVETNNLKGKLSIIARRIPKLPISNQGNPMINWEKGLPLNKFLAFLCRDKHDNLVSKQIILPSMVTQALELE
ncbi:MAG: Holliday junction resolvase [Methanobacteriota archaeon]|nr:MAG: Holliday junction resolvase [Euryarchaeota archaeon]|tara:strand:- start:6225 stop:6806 length:582 start_codon:yes stop_codon:yes gene_type:complete